MTAFPLRAILGLAAVLAVAPASQAQTAPPAGGPAWVDLRVAGGLSPVDQAVQDLDPLSTSLRRVDPGLALFSGRSQIYRADGTGSLGAASLNPYTGTVMPNRYLYRAPGVQAWMNQPNYIVRTGPGRNDLGSNVAPAVDGAFIETIPAGTVFDLVPRTPRRSSAPARPQPDHRIDYRINYRLRDPHADPASPHRFPPDRGWQMYKQKAVEEADAAARK